MKTLMVVILCNCLWTSEGLTSGFRRRVSTDNPLILKYARWAARHYGGRLETVRSAEEQVVAGLMLYIKFEMLGNTKRKICNVKIWVKEWANFKKLMPGSGCRHIDHRLRQPGTVFFWGEYM